MATVQVQLRPLLRHNRVQPYETGLFLSVNSLPIFSRTRRESSRFLGLWRKANTGGQPLGSQRGAERWSHPTPTARHRFLPRTVSAGSTEYLAVRTPGHSSPRYPRRCTAEVGYAKIRTPAILRCWREKRSRTVLYWPFRSKGLPEEDNHCLTVGT